MRASVIILCMFLLSCGSDNGSPVLSWDSNKEPDMKEYVIYACHEGADIVYTSVHHDPTIARHSVSIPYERVCYYIRAVDHDLNFSDPSEVVCL